ncbi:MAG: ABC-type transport auxiliary lipoprotein family protein [Pseudomonadota bacterium]
MKTSIILAGLSAVALSGCVSVLPEPEAPDALYTISAQTRFDDLPHTLIVREPEAPVILAGQALVSEGVDGELRLIPGVEWSGPATRQIQYSIIDSFAPEAPGHAVPPELGVLAAYELATRVSDLRLRGDTALCGIVVSVIASNRRELIARTYVSAEEAATSSSAKDRAMALSDAASDCAAQASQFALETLQTLP